MFFERRFFCRSFYFPVKVWDREEKIIENTRQLRDEFVLTLVDFDNKSFCVNFNENDVWIIIKSAES